MTQIDGLLEQGRTLGLEELEVRVDLAISSRDGT